jgi:hypothetical protein
MGVGFGLAPFALGTLADAAGPHRAFLLVYGLLAVAAAGGVVAVCRPHLMRATVTPSADRQQHRSRPVGSAGRHVVERDDRPVVRGFGERSPARPRSTLSITRTPPGRIRGTSASQ